VIPIEPHKQEEQERDLSTWVWLLIILGSFSIIGVCLLLSLEFILSYLVV